MAKQIVNVGVLPNDGQGDNLRAGATKLNNNFNELYTALGDGSVLSVVQNGVLNSYPSTATGSNKILSCITTLPVYQVLQPTTAC